jgi:fructose-1,6-bisphosphatase/inositol monophosphatase family enzyme
VNHEAARGDRRDFGTLNPNSVGTLMKEAVRRAIVAIRAQRFSFEARSKESHEHTDRPDFVTTADQAAQRVLVSLLRAWFPEYGIVAEEDHLRVPCTHPTHDIWFTVDPLDGTRAFMRRQSHGIGTMVSLVCDGEVIGACIGDVMTSEVYAARPDETVVHRVSEFGIAERLEVDGTRPLAEQGILIGDHGRPRSPHLVAMVASMTPLFGGIETASGSIGIGVARLWKSEVGAAVFGPFVRGSPWDLYPIIGISQRLGFRFLTLPQSGPIDVWQPDIGPLGTPVPREVLVIHESRLEELEAWASQNLEPGYGLAPAVRRG